ncbi:MAG: hypothetical protein SFX74_06305 [Fimbriimonadaceae bacterium]|nr:hypothetical protein [Fimbriimonadaceae bacterium]
MFHGNLEKRYPHLMAYLERTTVPAVSRGPNWAALSLVFVGSLVGVAAFATGAWVPFALAFTPISVGATIQHFHNRRPLPPASDLRLQSAGTLARLKEMVAHRRLHRDLDQLALDVLESCAESWSRVHYSMSNGAWARVELPTHYVALRDKVRAVADDTMHEVLLSFAPLLPDQVKSRDPMDYVSEAMESFGAGPRQSPRTHASALMLSSELADKLQRLAVEAESIVTSTQVEMQLQPGSGVDTVLGQLRDLKRAEEELADHTTVGM